MTTTQEETKDLTADTSPAIPEERSLSAEEVLLLQDMAEAGLLYGLTKRKTHPKMKPWIFVRRSGIEIINLENTVRELGKAAAFLASVSSSGKQIIIVGTTPATKAAVREFGAELNQPFVAERWLGGTLTNFRVIEGRIKYYNRLIADRDSGALSKYTKKERVMLDKKLEKMKTFFEGIANMNELPGAVLILDIQANKTAAREARAMNIPVVALVNTDTDPSVADYPIPANNRLSEGVKWVMNHLKESMKKTTVTASVPDKKE